MDRSSLLAFEGLGEGTRRAVPARFELRADASDPNILIWDGYSATTNQTYEVYGGPPYGWTEKIARGSFKKTLSEGADVAFKLNHEGMTLARTKSGTMDLSEDKKGERTVARLDQRMTTVADLAIASEREDIDEMSFAFRVVRDEWFDEDGEPSNAMVGTQRTILEINQNKGDVAAVNYGANPTTSGGFRDVDCALAELRAGHELTPDQAALVRGLAALAREDGSVGHANPDDPHQFDDNGGTGVCVVCNKTDADGNHVTANGLTVPVSHRLNDLRLELLARRVPA